MNIIMSGLEHNLAPIELRERLSFTKSKTSDIVQKIRKFPHINGCVLISTCNRTELYLSCDENVEPGQILCQAAGSEYTPYKAAFVTRRDEDAIIHLMEVSAGLRSRIWGEDQIIGQVKDAILLSREANAASPILETMFRFAISAGKEIRTRAHLTALPTSAAGSAVKLLQEKLGSLKGKTAIVIGNGKMGRLAVSSLQKAGCKVSVTLHTYRHGETVVPQGCGVIPYEERYLHMEGTDVLISATTSPHYTITANQLMQLKTPPVALVDLAIPRDIQPDVKNIDGIQLYNIDDLGDGIESRAVPPEVGEILKDHLDRFYRWQNYKDCLSTVDSLKEAIIDRVLTSKELEGEMSESDIIELSVSKAVDLMMGGLSEHLTAESLSKCENKIRIRTTARPVIS